MTPWTPAHQAFLSFNISWRLLKLLSVESVMLSRPLLSPSPLAFNLPGVRVFSKGSTYYYRRWRRASWKEWPLSSVNENEMFVPEGDEGSGVCLCVYSPWSARKGVPARGNSNVLRPGESRAYSEPCEQPGIFGRWNFSSVQLLSCVRLFATPWTAACQASLSTTNSWSLLKLMSKSVMLSNHFILCRPLLLLPSIFPSIRVFSSESVLHIRWPKYWSFSFSISPSNEYSGLISFRIDWFDPVVQGILKSLLQHHSSKASILQHLAFFTVPTLTSIHDHWENHSFF